MSPEFPIRETFRGRFLNVLAAKDEIFHLRNYSRQQASGLHVLDSRKDFRVLAKDAADLEKVLKPGTVDYIFTDPPYGAFISYLDLSILWNHWLGFPVSADAHGRETIVGGECALTEAHYKDSLARSIRACLRLLRPDRWFSVVFQHWDVSYFATILETASEGGAELKAAITQTGDVIWSMHKKKNSASVLAGEMILTFYKPAKTRKTLAAARPQPGEEPALVLENVFDACLNNGTQSFTSEALFNRLIVELWHRRALNCLTLGRREFVHQLQQRGWGYNSHTHRWNKGEHESSSEREPSLF